MLNRRFSMHLLISVSFLIKRPSSQRIGGGSEYGHGLEYDESGGSTNNGHGAWQNGLVQNHERPTAR